MTADPAVIAYLADVRRQRRGHEYPAAIGLIRGATNRLDGDALRDRVVGILDALDLVTSPEAIAQPAILDLPRTDPATDRTLSHGQRAAHRLLKRTREQLDDAADAGDALILTAAEVAALRDEDDPYMGDERDEDDDQ